MENYREFAGFRIVTNMNGVLEIAWQRDNWLIVCSFFFFILWKEILFKKRNLFFNEINTSILTPYSFPKTPRMPLTKKRHGHTCSSESIFSNSNYPPERLLLAISLKNRLRSKMMTIWDSNMPDMSVPIY